MHETEFFQQSDLIRNERLDWPKFKPLGRPCHECPVVDGMYRGLSNDLAKCAPPVVLAVSQRWLCHNNMNRACRGNWNNCGLDNAGQ